MTQTLKVKSTELVGPALNWAVGLANGWKRYDSAMRQHDGRIRLTLMFDVGTGCMRSFSSFQPTTFDQDGGPIIDSESIATSPVGNQWLAVATCAEDA